MTRIHRWLLAMLATTGLALPLTADAAQGLGFYVGALAGYSELGVSEGDWANAARDAFTAAGGALTSSSLKKDDVAWGLNAGFQLMRFFAIEADYYDLGKAKPAASGTVLTPNGTVPATLNGEFKSSGPAAALVFILPLDKLALDARVGGYYGKTELTASASGSGASATASQSKSEASLLAGAGVAWLFNDYLSLRLDYLYFDKVGDKATTGQANVNVVSLGVRFHFL